MASQPADIDAYLAKVPQDARATLEQLRRTIKSIAPSAVEAISYGMPTFKYRERPLIYFAAAKKHCALYGTAEGTIRFQPGEPPSAEHLRSLISARLAEIDASLR